ncbi:hypothetical protein [Nitrosomonas sp. PY1]|nr:hypothetical protein [Nitrosomonas sp. PY1]
MNAARVPVAFSRRYQRSHRLSLAAWLHEAAIHQEACRHACDPAV